MINVLYKISVWVLSALLLVMIVLISIVGVEESTLTVLGWITSFFILSSAVLFVFNRQKK